MTAMPDPRLQAQPPTGADGVEAAQHPWSVRAWPQRPAGPSALRGEEMWHRETSFLQICCSGCPCASSPQVARQCCGSNLTRCPGQGASGFPACRTDLRGQDRPQGTGQTPARAMPAPECRALQDQLLHWGLFMPLLRAHSAPKGIRDSSAALVQPPAFHCRHLVRALKGEAPGSWQHLQHLQSGS